MYGGGWIGQTIVVVATEYGGIPGILANEKTPLNLVGKKGKVIDANDNRYDTSYPTGHERITLIVQEDNGNWFEVDAATVIKG